MTFGRGIFQMPHVQIDSSGVHQKAAVAGRLVVTTMMQIQYTVTLSMKDMVADLVGKRGGRVVGAILMHDETVFGLQPEDPVQHKVRTMRLGCPWARAGPIPPARRRDTLRIPAGCDPTRRIRWIFQ